MIISKAYSLNHYSILDKKNILQKVPDPNTTYQAILLDIMMFCKFKLQNALSTEGLSDLLKKSKISLLKFLLS